MTIEEYNHVKNYNYRDYCSYLKLKYGSAKMDYYTQKFTYNPKVTRTEEGLFCHHIYEDTGISLSTKSIAQKYPFEYQKAENLCYCDYLEHLYLHILIGEQKTQYIGFHIIGIMIYELNDFYSGFIPKVN